MDYNYCQNCGKKIDADSEYCNWCGTKFISAKRKYVTFYELKSDELAKISKNDSISNKSSDVNKDITASEVKKTISDKSKSQKPIIPVSDNDFKIKKTADGYVLEKYTGKGENVVVPKGVTVIGENAFYECYSLTSIDLPNSVTSIGDSAFSKCDLLKSISIPEGVRSIGDGAFAFCVSLTSITIPASIHTIGKRAFGIYLDIDFGVVQNNNFKIRCYKGTAGEKYAVENGFDYELISNTINKSSIKPTIPVSDNEFKIKKTKKGYVLEKYTGKDIDVVVPKGVTIIGEKAFYDSMFLRNITIPIGLTSIGDYAFGECRELKNITIPNGVTSIGKGVFEQCLSLTHIVIPDSITNIGNYAFRFCGLLKSISIPDSVTNIGNSAFRFCRSLTHIVIPNGVTSIGNIAFYGCSSLISITIPANVNKIGVGAFGFDKELRKITNFKIKCYKGTAGEKYAIKYGFDYELIG